MVSCSPEPRSIEELVALVYEALEGVDASGDVRSLPTLALKLCDVLPGPLSDPHKKAIAAARRYLEAGEKEDADHWIHELASRIVRPYPPGTGDKAIAEERLIWVSLNRVGSFSDYGVEFVLYFAELAGIRFDQMLSAVQDVLAQREGG